MRGPHDLFRSAPRSTPCPCLTIFRLVKSTDQTVSVMREIQASEAKTHLPQIPRRSGTRRNRRHHPSRSGDRPSRAGGAASPSRNRPGDRGPRGTAAAGRQDHSCRAAGSAPRGPPPLMRFVLDASVALAWAFANEEHSAAAAALALIRDDEGCVPSLWGTTVGLPPTSVVISKDDQGKRLELCPCSC